jgi:hypothetical protein
LQDKNTFESSPLTHDSLDLEIAASNDKPPIFTTMPSDPELQTVWNTRDPSVFALNSDSPLCIIRGNHIRGQHQLVSEDCRTILTDAFAATELLFTQGSTSPETSSTLRKMIYDRLRRFSPGYNRYGIACKYAAHIHLRAVGYGVPHQDPRNHDDLKQLVDVVLKVDMQEWKDMIYVHLWV